MAQSSLWRLWRLGVVEVDAADMVYAADWVARGEVGAAESCSTRRTEAHCGAVDAADTGSTLRKGSHGAKSARRSHARRGGLRRIVARSMQRTWSRRCEGVARSEVGATESCSTRRTMAHCSAVDAADTGSTLWKRSHGAKSTRRSHARRGGLWRIVAQSMQRTRSRRCGGSRTERSRRGGVMLNAAD